MSDGDARVDAALRWRLILGRHGDTALPLDPADPPEAAAEGDSSGDWVERLEADAIDRTLQFIYDREFAERAHRTASGGEGHDGLTVPAWLAGVRTLFPRDAVEVLEKDALTRYGLHELVTDPDVLREAEPSRDLGLAGLGLAWLAFLSGVKTSRLVTSLAKPRSRLDPSRAKPGIVVKK